MSLIKPTRLAKAASYFNVAREEIVQYLTEKGFSIADNPNAKIEDDMFVVLNEKYSSEHDLKEESAQFLSQHNKPREEKLISATLKIEKIEEKEILAPENETNDKLDPNTPIISEETMDKVEIEKPTIKLKILDKIDIGNLGNKKPKKTLTKTEKIIPTEEEKEVEENTVEKKSFGETSK